MLSATHLPTETLMELYRLLLRIRRFEERIVSLYPEQQMKTPAHLCLGQEVALVGGDNETVWANGCRAESGTVDLDGNLLHLISRLKPLP